MIVPFHPRAAAIVWMQWRSGHSVTLGNTPGSAKQGDVDMTEWHRVEESPFRDEDNKPVRMSVCQLVVGPNPLRWTAEGNALRPLGSVCRRCQ